MQIKYSALNDAQLELLNALSDGFQWPKDVPAPEDEHFHHCRDCGVTWGHVDTLCYEPEDVTLICPDCENQYSNDDWKDPMRDTQ